MTPRAPVRIIGVVPAAGLATRLGRLPCSKELLPVPHRDAAELRLKPVGEYLLERMRDAGASEIYVVLRDGKWDIPRYFGDGAMLGVDIAYLMMRRPDGPAFTIGQVYPFAHEARVLLGFPDILFEPADAFARLLERLSATGADVVLGLIPTDRPEKMDMVDVEGGGRVRAIHIKEPSGKPGYAWIVAAWAPSFTGFLHRHLRQLELDHPHGVPDEVHVGRVMQAALAAGLVIDTVPFPDGRCLDIGTPEDLARALELRD